MLTHTLLRLASAASLSADTPFPEWVREQLARAPWVVVRRAPPRGDALAVGVRGRTRSERFAAWLPRNAVLASATPQQLAGQRGWRAHPRRSAVPALQALDEVEPVMADGALGAYWGPGGSVAFELASGCPTADAHSDLDLIVQPLMRLTRLEAEALETRLRALPVRTDVLVETPCGGLALHEYASGGPPFLLRTASGPRWLAEPWAAPGTAAA